MADDLNTRIRMTVRSSNLLQRAVDTTLSISGQAADAAAVGAALATKADVSQVTGISVNGEAADQQGKILIDGSDIPVSGTDATKLDVKIAALDGKTAADIPMSSATGAQSVADAINNGVARNADAIPLEAGSTTMVKGAIDSLNTNVTAIQGWTAADIPMTILGQLGNRIQHALRAYTPLDQKAVKVAAQTFRTNPSFDTEEAITTLKTGEALVSFLDEHGAPGVVERATILPPQSYMGAISNEIRTQVIGASPFKGKYDPPAAPAGVQGQVQQAGTVPAPQQTPQFYLVNGILWRVNYVNPTAYITVNGMLLPVSR